MKMLRDQRDEWPSDSPVGTFDISVGGLRRAQSSGGGLVTGVTAHILYVCPNRKRCAVFMGPDPVQALPDLYVWGWDGNLERPTLNPSINCVGGCGWHGHIVGGDIT
jgi:hypothetical protein